MMMDEQMRFVVLMGACVFVGMFLSLISNEREQVTRKFTEEEMKQYLLPKEDAGREIRKD